MKNILLIITLAILSIFMLGCEYNNEFLNNNNQIPDNNYIIEHDKDIHLHEDDHEHDHDHDHSVEIEGKDLKALTVEEVANLWEIYAEILLEEIIKEFNFKKPYTTKTILEEMRNEYKFSPAIIKDIAEDLKSKKE
jgi:reverse gyrase